MTASKAGRRDLVIIAFTAFMNFIGLTLAIPIFTPLCLEQTGNILPADASMPPSNHYTGVVVGCFPPCASFLPHRCWGRFRTDGAEKKYCCMP